MAAFDHIPMGENGLKEVYRWLDGFAEENKGIAHKEVLGKSPDHWDIPGIFVTNKDMADDRKQIAVVTAARHGQEFGARVVAPEILRFLTSEEARKIRDTQIVIVVPVVNPEGFVSNQFCSSMTSLTKTERFILGGLFRAYPPDMIIDYHSLGAESGSKYDIGSCLRIQPSVLWMNRSIYMWRKEWLMRLRRRAGLTKYTRWRIWLHTISEKGNSAICHGPPLRRRCFCFICRISMMTMTSQKRLPQTS
jgi:hypothetical protein